ncbi:MAG: sensor histidine kinase [Solirubrobacteraceae bacterium]
MPLRRRISLVAAATVALAVGVAMVIAYFAVRNQQIGQVDSELRAQAAQIQTNPYIALQAQHFPELSAKAGGPIPYWQVESAAGGAPLVSSGGLTLPDTYGAAAVASGERPAYFANIRAGGTTLREYVFLLRGYTAQATGQAVAVQLARPLAPVENVLDTLRWVLLVVFFAVVVMAAGLAQIVTRHVLTPLATVSRTAELIGETEDLTQRIDVHTNDEVGLLADRFNAMLDRLQRSRITLDASMAAQRQLVADASHELRTPVTSLRTNIEVLLSGADLGEDDRQRLLTDVVEQSEELSLLVANLIEVARGDSPPETVEKLPLDALVEEALDRAKRNTPGIEFDEQLTSVYVQGNADRLLRAINNLIDNAAKHASGTGPIEVRVDDTGVTVRDHGEGISEADLPHIFDRFYRGANSRSRQGSGLGLAIVRQAAEQHGGTVTAANAPGGGAVFTLSLPTCDPPSQLELDSDSLADAGF